MVGLGGDRPWMVVLARLAIAGAALPALYHLGPTLIGITLLLD